MSSFANTLARDTKPRAPSPSEAHVVDINEGNVTEEPIYHASRPRAPNTDNIMIHVQPLKKSEMQPSYAQDLGTTDVVHGVYGSLMQYLGSVVGLLGAFSLLPVPKSIQGSPTRFRRSCLTFWSILQVCGPRSRSSQCLYRVAASCRR